MGVLLALIEVQGHRLLMSMTRAFVSRMLEITVIDLTSSCPIGPSEPRFAVQNGSQSCCALG